MKNDFNYLKNEIIDKDFCTRCGTCIGICPAECIAFCNEQIIKNGRNCIACGQCYLNCPGKFFDFCQYNHSLFNERYDTERILGSYKKVYTGHSTSESIRNAASSGGVVSEIAAFLLKEHYVDGVVVVSGNENKQNFDVKIARTIKEIYNAAQSKYTIIPTNKIFQAILNEPGKYAYIGLPCQVHGLRKAMKNNTVLRERIFIVIGLFCGFNMHFKATEYLIKKSKININNIIDFSYRKKIGDSTGFYISDSTKQFFVNKHEYTFLNLFFSPQRCLMCYDYSAEFADISVGDAWEMELGHSRIIVRDEIGQRIIEKCIESNTIVCAESSENAVKKSQQKIINHKKRDIWYRWQKHKNIPEINITPPENVKISLMGKFQYYIMCIGKKGLTQKLICLIPFVLLRKMSSFLRK